MATKDIPGYREFLRKRDGTPDPVNHTLSNRERFFDFIEQNPVRSNLAIDRDAFLRNLYRRRPEAGLDDRVLWLLITAKLNQGERFGIKLADSYGIPTAPDAAPELVHVILQEHYHSRLLATVLGMFDLPFPNLEPHWLFRGMIKAVVLDRDNWSLPLAGASELVGSVLFHILRMRGLELFAEDGPVAERIQLLYDEVLADEVSHVGYFAARLSPLRRRIMRGLTPIVAAVIAKQTPEILSLFSRKELTKSLKAPYLLDKIAAEFPDRAYVATQI